MTRELAAASIPRVGSRSRKIDAAEKVAGQFTFASDLDMPGMLFGATVRSEHAHARILSVDTAQARAMPGVVAVLTAADVPGQPNCGIELRDQPVLAVDRVRFRGEPIAVIAAVDQATARRAVRAVRVSYEPLPTIDDPEIGRAHV